jgi:prepilin-type N-terminal cleavage/methylation domain-containing protein
MMNNQFGFTLIEIIVSLVLLGIMAAIAGMGLVAVSRGYIFTKENAHISQKAQLAVDRLSKELLELNDITDATTTSIAFTGSQGTRLFGYVPVEKAVKIAEESSVPLADGDILVDNVSGFALSFLKQGGNWVFGTDDITLLEAVQIDLTLGRLGINPGNKTFTITIYPRNIRKK